MTADGDDSAVTARVLGGWVDQCLSEYVEVHERVFKKSRFRRIDHGQHRAALGRIANDLDGIDGLALIRLSSTLSPEEQAFLEHLRLYLATLTRAVRALSDITERLDTEASGSKTGPYSSFRDDVRRYEDLGREYQKLGARLTTLYQGLPS
jgi:hypothetical protein